MRTKNSWKLPQSGIPEIARKKILEKLKKHKRINTSEIEKILIRYGVSGDVETLQHSYRLNLAQHLMAGMRDAKGQREVLALRCKNGTSDYIAIEFCDG